MAITARSENRSIVDLEQVWVHFISARDGRVQATTRSANMKC